MNKFILKIKKKQKNSEIQYRGRKKKKKKPSQMAQPLVSGMPLFLFHWILKPSKACL